MRIGQIVFVDKESSKLQTGIIVRKERCQAGDFWWYEVLCNDGQNHVLPGYLLSPASAVKSNIRTKKELHKYLKNNAQLYKYHNNPVTLYT